VILSQVNLVFGDEPEIVLKVVMKLKTPLSLHNFQFLALDTIIGCVV
jgi:hypothetical protein